MNKNKIFKLSIFLIIIILVLTNIYLFRIIRQINFNVKSFKNIDTKQPDYISNTPLADELITKSCTEGDSNVYFTECEIELLDITAAQREWKQRKLEALKHPQINIYDLSGSLEEWLTTIKNWRNDFEKMRDAWCDARVAFINGSGIPRVQTECKIEFELLAINDLNDLYYNTIMTRVFDSQGIPDFEPTKENIDALANTNKTIRGCIWAGEDTNCE